MTELTEKIEKSEENVLIIKYGEIAVRGNNRKFFIERLLRTIRKNLDGMGDFYVVKEQGRLILEDRGGEIDFDRVIPKVLCIMGIIGVSPGVRVKDQSLENLRAKYTAPEIIGKLAYAYGLQPEPAPRTPESLVLDFAWTKVPKQDICLPEGLF